MRGAVPSRCTSTTDRFNSACTTVDPICRCIWAIADITATATITTAMAITAITTPAFIAARTTMTGGIATVVMGIMTAITTITPTTAIAAIGIATVTGADMTGMDAVADVTMATVMAAGTDATGVAMGGMIVATATDIVIAVDGTMGIGTNARAAPGYAAGIDSAAGSSNAGKLAARKQRNTP